MDKYEARRIATMKQYIRRDIDRVTFDAKIAIINEEEQKEMEEGGGKNRM
ncbi:hypothetical protein [Tepidanaerobacter acetatoxydans]|nr:hypothetical protein [Tepidanaerobacter acetatoxydans]